VPLSLGSRHRYDLTREVMKKAAQVSKARLPFLHSGYLLSANLTIATEFKDQLLALKGLFRI
jgi:hypothetical protein